MRKYSLFVTLLVLLALSLTACEQGALGPGGTEPNQAPTEEAAAAPTEGATAEPAEATTAPEPTETAAPTSAPVAEASIAGTWRIANMEECMTAAMSQDSSMGEGLTFDGITGSMLYTLDEDSQVTIVADDYTFTYKLGVPGVDPIVVNMTIDGTASGTYALEDGTIRFVSGDVGTLSFKLTVNGQVLAGIAAATESSVSDMFPGSRGEKSCAYTLDGDTLTLSAPSPSPCSIILERVR